MLKTNPILPPRRILALFAIALLLPVFGFGQQVRLSVLVGPTFSGGNFNRIQTSGYQFRQSMGYSVGGFIDYCSNKKWGLSTGMLLQNATYKLQMDPFPSDEVSGSEASTYSIQQLSIPLNITYTTPLLKGRYELSFFAGPTLSRVNIASWGHESRGGKVSDDTVAVSIRSTGGPVDFSNFYALGLNAGIQVHPLKKVSWLAAGLRWNAHLGWGPDITATSTYQSPYTGIVHTRSYNVTCRPAFLAVFLQFNLFDMNFGREKGE